MTQFSVADHEYMARALQLAERGLCTTMPNPRVGCVLVRDGAMVGEGWHEYAGGPHAEVNALQQAGAGARGAAGGGRAGAARMRDRRTDQCVNDGGRGIGPSRQRH